MEFKVFEKKDIKLMKNFVDDEKSMYDKTLLKDFLKEKNAYAFIAKDGEMIAGFAYGYVFLRPDGKRDFYLHAIDVMESYQGKGVGTGLMRFIVNHSKSTRCRKLFLITNKGNVSACRCYEKAGGVNPADDDVVYVYKD